MKESDPTSELITWGELLKASDGWRGQQNHEMQVRIINGRKQPNSIGSVACLPTPDPGQSLIPAQTTPADRVSSSHSVEDSLPNLGVGQIDKSVVNL